MKLSSRCRKSGNTLQAALCYHEAIRSKVPEILPEEKNKVVLLHGWQCQYPMSRCRTSGNTLQAALCCLEAIRSKVPEILPEEKKGCSSAWLAMPIPNEFGSVRKHPSSCSLLPRSHSFQSSQNIMGGKNKKQLLFCMVGNANTQRVAAEHPETPFKLLSAASKPFVPKLPKYYRRKKKKVVVLLGWQCQYQM